MDSPKGASIAIIDNLSGRKTHDRRDVHTESVAQISLTIAEADIVGWDL